MLQIIIFIAAKKRSFLFCILTTTFFNANAEQETTMKISKNPALANLISFCIGNIKLNNVIITAQNKTAKTGSRLELTSPKAFGNMLSLERLNIHLLMPYITIKRTEKVADIAASNIKSFKK